MEQKRAFDKLRPNGIGRYRVNPAAPILLFDSGVGGLTVLAELRKLLPDAPVIYAADTAGFDNYYGWGRLNTYNSLLLAQSKIDRVIFTNNNVILSWPSPSNASNREPYAVEYQAVGATNWFPGLPNFTYTSTRTWWTNVSPRATSTCYRLRIRETF